MGHDPIKTGTTVPIFGGTNGSTPGRYSLKDLFVVAQLRLQLQASGLQRQLLEPKAAKGGQSFTGQENIP